MAKRALCLVFALIFSIENFAATVSDNDGSAFITKAEFDSLKNNFQSQLDSYNTGIDSKIDAAIANYLVGNKVARKIMPDILLNSLKENRRTFTNDWVNPTSSTQDDLYLQINKNVINIYCTGHVKSESYPSLQDSLTFYALNSLAGRHAKDRVPVDNGGTGKYMLVHEYLKDPGKYYIEDNGLYDVKEVIEISGGQTSDSYLDGWNWFYYAYDDKLDFSDKTTDSIWTTNTLVGYVYKVPKTSTGAPDETGFIPSPYGGGKYPPSDKILEQANVTLNTMCSICVMETNTGEQSIFNTMSSGGVWNSTTGTIRKDGVHSWKYKYTDVVLAGVGAQCYGNIFWWDSGATNPNTGANTGWRKTKRLNVANDYYNETEPLTFMGPKVDMIRGSDFIVKDVSDIVNESLYYYSGLPLFKMPFEGKVTLKLNLDFTNLNDTVVAVRNEPFDNTSISAKSSKDIYWKKWASADLSSGEISIEIPQKDLKSSVNKTLYIKLYNTNSALNSDVRVYVNECVLEGD